MQALADRVLERMKHRIFDLGRAADGSPLPKGVDLVRTGAFRRSLEVVIRSERLAAIQPGGIPYAGKLEDRYGWAGLSRAEQRELDEALSESVDEAIERST